MKRNVRFGEYSPLHPANKVNSQPFLGVGEYDVKREKKLELQNKQYISRVNNLKAFNLVNLNYLIHNKTLFLKQNK